MDGKECITITHINIEDNNVSIYINCEVFRNLLITTIVITCKEEGLTLNC